MPSVIDVSSACGGRAADLAAAGVKTVIRYYSRDTISASKRLSSAEAQQLAAAGLRIGIVHEGRFGNDVGNFEHASGVADGSYVQSYATSVIRQPAGSTIYFAVDCDVSSGQIASAIVPYFQGVAESFASASGGPSYEIGVYGSGLLCATLLDAGLAKRAWLAQSTGWRGYAAFDGSGRWALKQLMPSSVGGVACDPDIASPSLSIGDFALGSSLFGVDLRSAPMVVNSRAGLHLRAGPGVEFEGRHLLSFGQELYPLASYGHWTLVDLSGDGAADGFVCGPFLKHALHLEEEPARPSIDVGLREPVAQTGKRRRSRKRP